MIAILHADDPAYVHEAAKRGVFAYIIDGIPEELQSAIDITLQRFAEYQSLQGAFGRRAIIEQAKGILMARYSINADAVFERLRDHSEHNGRKLSEIAAAVVDSHLLRFPRQPNRTNPCNWRHWVPQRRRRVRRVRGTSLYESAESDSTPTAEQLQKIDA